MKTFLFLILLAGVAHAQTYAPRGMPGQVPLNRIVPQMGNPAPRGSIGNPVYAIPPGWRPPPGGPNQPNFPNGYAPPPGYVPAPGGRIQPIQPFVPRSRQDIEDDADDE